MSVPVAIMSTVTAMRVARAVADGVNVGYDVWRIRTEVTEQGGKVEAGFHVDRRNRLDRSTRWEQLDEDFEFEARHLDRSVVVPTSAPSCGRSNPAARLLGARRGSRDLASGCACDRVAENATFVAVKATSETVGDLLFPAAYRRRVLSLLLLHPDRALHVREIARLTGTTAGTLNKELARLHRAGLLAREAVGNQVRYSADRASPVYDELAGILRKTVGLADVLAEALAPAAKSIAVAFVFGSIARASESARSDVDVMLIGDIGFGDAVRLLSPAGTALGREVNPKVYSAAQWRAAVKAKDPFLLEVLARPKIFLIGNDDELENAGRRQPR